MGTICVCTTTVNSEQITSINLLTQLFNSPLPNVMNVIEGLLAYLYLSATTDADIVMVSDSSLMTRSELGPSAFHINFA